MVKQTIRNPYGKLEIVEVGPTEEEERESWQRYCEAQAELSRQQEAARERRRIEAMNGEAYIIVNGFSNSNSNNGIPKFLSAGQQEQYLKNKH